MVRIRFIADSSPLCPPWYSVRVTDETGDSTTVRLLFGFWEVNECNRDVSPNDIQGHSVRIDDKPGVIAARCGVSRLSLESDLRFGVDRLNQGLDVAVAERERLETAGILRVTWQVIRTNRARELRVPQDSHNF